MTEPTKEPELTEIESTQQEHSLLESVDLDARTRIDGIVIGTFEAIDGDGLPLVTYPGQETPLRGQSTVPVDDSQAGRQVALTFLQGSPLRPLILGFLQHPQGAEASPITASLDGKLVTLEARSNLELRCGKASIKLTSDGKIILKGTHVLSRSSGPNKIKGASVSIN